MSNKQFFFVGLMLLLATIGMFVAPLFLDHELWQLSLGAAALIFSGGLFWSVASEFNVNPWRRNLRLTALLLHGLGGIGLVACQTFYPPAGVVVVALTVSPSLFKWAILGAALTFTPGEEPPSREVT